MNLEFTAVLRLAYHIPQELQLKTASEIGVPKIN